MPSCPRNGEKGLFSFITSVVSSVASTLSTLLNIHVPGDATVGSVMRPKLYTKSAATTFRVLSGVPNSAFLWNSTSSLRMKV